MKDLRNRAQDSVPHFALFIKDDTQIGSIVTCVASPAGIGMAALWGVSKLNYWYLPTEQTSPSVVSIFRCFQAVACKTDTIMCWHGTDPPILTSGQYLN